MYLYIFVTGGKIYEKKSQDKCTCECKSQTYKQYMTHKAV